MQHLLNVLEPATSVALLTLDEAKTALNIPASDTTKDQSLTFFIENMSDTLATLVSRVFVKEKVEETFYDISTDWPPNRLFCSRWPVLITDIESIVDAGGNDLLNVTPRPWTLEQRTGMLYRTDGNGWSGTIDMIYSGGYDLPDDAPPALKQLAVGLTREAYYQMLLGSISAGNIRMVSHKHARVMFFPTGAQQGAAGMRGVAASPAIQKAVDNVLGHFWRPWL
jgi:hypothetical protein